MLSPIPHSEKQGDFYAWHSWTETNLENLLQISFKKEDTKSAKLSLTRLHRLAKFCYEKKEASGVFYLAILVRMTNDLDFLKTNSLQHFESFRGILTSGISNQFSSVQGRGFEIKVTRILVENGFTFHCPDPPDFCISFLDKTLSIECYAPTAPENKEYYSKIYDKKVKPYFGKDWIEHFPILFVDVSHWRLVENDSSLLLESHRSSDPIEKTLLDLAKNTFYQLVVFFHFGRTADPKLNGATTGLQYSPKENLNPILQGFINKLSSEFTDKKIDIYLSPFPPGQ